jgi:hypothetical protein
MAIFGAIYLSFKGNNLEHVTEISDRLKGQNYYFVVRYHEKTPWVQLYVEEPENIVNYSEIVAQLFPNKHIIGLGAYTVSDAVVFCEFKQAQLIRLLQSGFNHKRCWDRIEGEKQPWEAELLGHLTLKIGSPGMVSYQINQIGIHWNLPGFGIPQPGEPWRKEIIN